MRPPLPAMSIGQRQEVPDVKTYTITGNPGTTLSCAAAMSAAISQGTGMRRASEDARLAGYAGWLRHVTDSSRAFGIDLVPVNADFPKAKQPKTHVPQPPHERSP
jgi:hypothetical protein